MLPSILTTKSNWHNYDLHNAKSNVNLQVLNPQNILHCRVVLHCTVAKIKPCLTFFAGPPCIIVSETNEGAAD